LHDLAYIIPSRSQGNELAYIVHTADAIAMMTGLGLGIDGMYILSPRFTHRLTPDIVVQMLLPKLQS